MTLGILFGDAGWTLLILVFALVLDAMVGEPEAIYARLPHPAALMGRAVGALDAAWNREEITPARRQALGVLAILLLTGGAGALGAAVQAIPYLGPALAMLATAALLAQKSLVDHVNAVADGLDAGLAEGREAVSRIVGRDPESLDAAGVGRAAVESAAENFSDGVAAPAFWFLLAGLPGIAIYKMVNTADSMIGYRTPRHLAFGWAAARLDDALNLAPARLSAVLLAAASRRPRESLAAAWRDARTHASPNAGWPEAAAAGALDLALAGPRRYGGKLSDDPYLHAKGRKVVSAWDVRQSTILITRAHLGLTALCLIAAAFAL